MKLTEASKYLYDAPIDIERPSLEFKKGKYITLKLRANPSDEGSATYEMQMRFFDTGSCEEWLLFLNNLEKVFIGQNITAGPQKFAMARRLLKGGTLAAFNRHANGQTETNANYTVVIRQTTEYVFPNNALYLQMQYMRRQMRKPLSMKIREYEARVQELVAYLPQFPPFAANQTLSQQELVEYIHAGIPNSWKKEMVKQGFNPFLHDANVFVEFCERQELTEEKPEPKANAKKPDEDSSKGKNKQSGSKRKGGGNPGAKSGKFCELHQTDTHNTADCYAVKQMIKKRREGDSTKNKENAKKFKSFNSEELNAMVSLWDKVQKHRSNKREEESVHMTNDEPKNVQANSMEDVEDLSTLYREALMETDTDVAEMSDDELLNFSLDDPIPKKKNKANKSKTTE